VILSDGNQPGRKSAVGVSTEAEDTAEDSGLRRLGACCSVRTSSKSSINAITIQTPQTRDSCREDDGSVWGRHKELSMSLCKI
jgi:hypothetical protein